MAVNDMKGFTFFISYYNAYNDLEDEDDRNEFLKAIVLYIFENKEPEFKHKYMNAVFRGIEYNLKSSIKNGMNGSRKKNENENVNMNENKNMNENENKNKKAETGSDEDQNEIEAKSKSDRNEIDSESIKESFFKFWEKFPEGKQLEKNDAFEAYKKIVRGGVDENYIIGAADEYMNHCIRIKLPIQFVNMPKDFLKNGFYKEYGDKWVKHNIPYDEMED